MAKISKPSIGSVVVAVTEVEHDWIEDMLKFKDNGSLPEDRSSAQRVRRTSPSYCLTFRGIGNPLRERYHEDKQANKKA
ncbi:hypothetical protein BHE74_00005783 [Ensete ventricosum]|nr:hypothetical protein BHE74_00005783 [Ensete ventricosum]